MGTLGVVGGSGTSQGLVVGGDMMVSWGTSLVGAGSAILLAATSSSLSLSLVCTKILSFLVPILYFNNFNMFCSCGCSKGIEVEEQEPSLLAFMMTDVVLLVVGCSVSCVGSVGSGGGVALSNSLLSSSHCCLLQMRFLRGYSCSSFSESEF